MFFTLLVVLIVVVAILLSLVVLLQSGQGGGLAGIASGGQATQILGARQAPDLLEKASWTLGGALIFLCFIAPFTIGGEQQRSILQENAGSAPVEAPALNPNAPAEGTPAPGTPAPAGGGDGAAPPEPATE